MLIKNDKKDDFSKFKNNLFATNYGLTNLSSSQKQINREGAITGYKLIIVFKITCRPTHLGGSANALICHFFKISQFFFFWFRFSYTVQAYSVATPLAVERSSSENAERRPHLYIPRTWCMMFDGFKCLCQMNNNIQQNTNCFQRHVMSGMPVIGNSIGVTLQEAMLGVNTCSNKRF